MTLPDFERALQFYDELLASIGVRRLWKIDSMTWGPSRQDAALCLTTPYDGNPATVGNGVMIAIRDLTAATGSPQPVVAVVYLRIFPNIFLGVGSYSRLCSSTRRNGDTVMSIRYSHPVVAGGLSRLERLAWNFTRGLLRRVGHSGLLGIALLSQPVMANPTGVDRSDLVRLLADRYAEAPIATELTDGGNSVNKETAR